MGAILSISGDGVFSLSGLLTIGQPCTALDDYIADVLLDSPAVYYRFNDASGPTAVDSSGNARDGTYVGATHTFQQTPGPTGCIPDEYVAQAGSSSSVDVTEAALDVIGAVGQDFTLEIWVRLSGTGDAFIEKTTAAGGSNWNSLASVTSISGKVRFQLLDGGSNPFIDSASAINDGGWHHVVGVADRVAGEIRLYVDGAVAATAVAIPSNGSFDSSNTADTEFGDRNVGSGAGSMTGDMAHAAIYLSALTSTRIFSHYNIAIGNEDLPAAEVWFDFSDITSLYQDSSKTTPVTTDLDPIGAVEDKTGNGQDLLQSTAAARPVYTTDQQNGLSVADTDPTGTALYLERLAASWVTIPRPYTLVAVGRTPASVVASFTRAFVFATDASSGTAMIGLAPTVTNGGTWAYRNSSTSRNSVTYADFAAVGADTWYITMMVCPVAGDITVYQNNVIDPISSGLTSQDFIRGMRLGHDRNLGSKDNGCWRGAMGEVRIFGFDADVAENRTTIYNALAAKWGL